MHSYNHFINDAIGKAATMAMEEANVLYILPWASPESEQKVRDAFETVMHAREKDDDARVIADKWFTETIIRLHNEQSAEFRTAQNSIKDNSDVALGLAKQALESGDTDELEDFLEDTIEEALKKCMDRYKETATFDIRDTAAARAHLRATIAFLQMVNELFSLLSGNRETYIKHAEARAKELLGLPFSKRHPATAEALSAHHG